jgi:hypothetical protein
MTPETPNPEDLVATCPTGDETETTTLSQAELKRLLEQMQGKSRPTRAVRVSKRKMQKQSRKQNRGK